MAPSSVGMVPVKVFSPSPLEKGNKIRSTTALCWSNSTKKETRPQLHRSAAGEQADLSGDGSCQFQVVKVTSDRRRSHITTPFSTKVPHPRNHVPHKPGGIRAGPRNGQGFSKWGCQCQSIGNPLSIQTPIWDFSTDFLNPILVRHCSLPNIKKGRILR